MLRLISSVAGRQPRLLLAFERPFNLNRGKFERLAYNTLGGRKNGDAEAPMACAWREFCEETGCSNEHMPVDKAELDRLRQLLNDAPVLWVPSGKYCLFMIDILDCDQWRSIISLPDLYRALPTKLRKTVRLYIDCVLPATFVILIP